MCSFVRTMYGEDPSLFIQGFVGNINQVSKVRILAGLLFDTVPANVEQFEVSPFHGGIARTTVDTFTDYQKEEGFQEVI